MKPLAAYGGTLFIDCQKLRPADIILTAERSTASRVVRAATRGPFSHAALVIERSLIFESTAEGIGYTRLSCTRLEYPTESHGVRQLHLLPAPITKVTVLRREELADVSMGQLAKLVAPFLWKQYPALADTSAVFDGPTTRRTTSALLRLHERFSSGRPSNPGFFCSQLVAAVFEALDSPLIPGIAPERFAPNRILKAGLSEVSHAVTLADPSAEVDEAKRELINKLAVALPFPREVLPGLVDLQNTVEKLRRRER